MKKRILFNLLFLVVYYGLMFIFKPNQIELGNFIVIPATFTIAYQGLSFYLINKEKKSIDKNE